MGPQLNFLFWGDSVVLWKGHFLFWGDPVVLCKGKPFSLQASLAPVLKNVSQLTPLKQISLLASWVFPYPLKIWQGATFSKDCHKEFGSWGPQLNFLFRDFNHHLLVGGGGRLGGAGGAERDRSCTELGINCHCFGGKHFSGFFAPHKNFCVLTPPCAFKGCEYFCVFFFFCVLTPHLLFAT